MLVALAKKVISWNSIPKVTAFAELFQTYVKTDLSASDMLFSATQAMGVDFSSGITQGELTGRGDGVVGNSKWCYVFQPEDILPTLNEQLNPYTRDSPPMTWIASAGRLSSELLTPQGHPKLWAAHFYFLHRSRLTTGRFHGMMEKKAERMRQLWNNGRSRWRAGTRNSRPCATSFTGSRSAPFRSIRPPS